MLGVRDLVKLKINWPEIVWWWLWMRVVGNTLRLKYTDFVLTNDSELDKNKMLFFTFIFIWLLGKLDKEEPTVKQINKNSLTSPSGENVQWRCSKVYT